MQEEGRTASTHWNPDVLCLVPPFCPHNHPPGRWPLISFSLETLDLLKYCREMKGLAGSQESSEAQVSRKGPPSSSGKADSAGIHDENTQIYQDSELQDTPGLLVLASDDWHSCYFFFPVVSLDRAMCGQSWWMSKDCSLLNLIHWLSRYGRVISRVIKKASTLKFIISHPASDTQEHYHSENSHHRNKGFWQD